MAKKSVAERLEEHKKNRANGGSNTTTASSSTRTSVADRLDRHKLERSVNLDTFESDLSNVNTTLSSALSSWQTQETMQNLRSSIESMYKRTNDYQTYLSKYQPDTKVNLGDLSSYFEDVLGNWDGIASTYGRYKDADSYTKETTKLKELTSMTKDELASHLKDKNSIAYTTYGGQDITWQSLFDEKDHAERATSKEGAEGWKKYLADESAKAEEAKAKEANKKWYDTVLENYSTYDTSNIGGLLAQTIADKRKDTSYQNPTDEWTEEEQNIFGAYYLQDPEKAYEYATNVNNSKAMAKKEGQKQNITDSATSGFLAGAGHTIGSLASAPFAIADFLDDFTDKVAGRPIVEEGVLSPFEYSQAVQGGIGTHLNEKSGTINENVPIIGGKGLGDLYGVGTSIAQSALSGYALGGIGTMISYFGQGASAGIDEALARGASDEQAMLYGVLVGAGEGISEKIGVDNMFKLGSADTVKGFITNVLKQAGSEGIEEGISSIISEVSDRIVMQDKSVFENAVRTYMTQGMTEAEAKKQAGKDTFNTIAWDAVAGALSGGVHGGIQTSLQSGVENRMNKKVGSVIRENETMDDLKDFASEIGGDSYQKYIDLIESGKIKDAQLGKLFNEVESKTISDYNSEVYNSRMRQVADMAIELGDTKNSGLIASAVLKEKDGQELTREEKAVLKTDTAQSILETLGDKNIESKTSESINKALKRAWQVDSITTPRTVEEKAVASATKEAKAQAQEIQTKVNEKVEAEGREDISFYSESMEKAKAEAFNRIYDGNTDLESYANSFELAYTYGKNKIGVSEALKNKGVLTESQALKAYEAGNIGRAIKKQEMVDAINKKHAGKTFVKGKFNDSIIDYTGHAEGKVAWADLTERQKKSINFVRAFAEVTGVNVEIITSKVVDEETGKRAGENGRYESSNNTIYIDAYAGIDAGVVEDAIVPTLSHEVTHWMKAKAPAMYQKMETFLLETLAESGKMTVNQMIAKQKFDMKRNHPDMKVTDESAIDELVARGAEDMLANSEKIRELLGNMTESEQKTFIDKVKEVFQNIIDWVNDLLGQYDSKSKEAELLRQYENRMKELSKMWDEALTEAIKTNQSMQAEGITDAKINAVTEKVGVGVDTETNSAYPAQMSERTWTASEYVQNKEVAVKALVKALGVTEADAKRYIDNINSIAKLIADDRARLDYDPNVDDRASVLKTNKDYKWTVDMSTLCAKRLLFTGTFDAIQKKLPNTALDSDDIVALRSLMMSRGYEVACGICYVESTRRELGTITEDFIERYKLSQKTGKPITRVNSKGKVVELTKTQEEKKTTIDKSSDKFFADKNYTPTLAELNTTDIDKVKVEHPAVYEAYLNYMNARGQAKPKLLETRTEYKGEIAKMYARKKNGEISNSAESMNASGGLRLQSFSDFEIAHLIDMMQITLDMSGAGLMSQAYTKVPAFAEVFGDTGIKINLSLIAKGSGLDENGNLIFDDVEGINHKEAFRLREKYSKNVGTILVGKNDAHIIKAMADPRIDYIIPFHKSSWKESLYDALGLTGYDDYTNTQNEKPLDPDRKIHNFLPSEYWDYSKSGDENAKTYLEMCKADGRIPKFPQFQNYEGYWKLLIDFKMYDNDGVGSPQTAVMPNFDMKSANRILNEYKGGHRSFPVAEDVVDKFVDDYKKAHPQAQYSDRAYMEAVNNGDMETAQKMVDAKALELGARRFPNGKLINYYHGTRENFTSFDIEKAKQGVYGFGFYFSPMKTKAEYYTDEENGKLISAYIFTDKLATHNDYNLKADDVKKVLDDFNVPIDEQEWLWHEYGSIDEWLKEDSDRIALQEIEKRIYRNSDASVEEILNAFRTVFGYDGIQANNETILFDNKLMKSAEPVTYDDQGNVIPLSERFNTESEDIRYSDRDSAGNVLTAEQKEYFKNSKVRDKNGNLMVAYHGSPAQFTVFDKNRIGKGTDQFGAGFYFGTTEEVADAYGENKYKVYLNITKPIKISRSLDGGDLYNVEITPRQAYEIAKKHPKMRDAEESPLGDFVPEYWEEGAKDWMIRELAKSYTTIGLLDGDLFREYPNELHEAIRDVIGYDGVEISFDNTDSKFYVAWFDNQMKNTSNTTPTTDSDIRYSDRDYTSVYELMGEKETLDEENRKLKADIEKLKATIGSEDVKIARFRSLADYLKKQAGSNYSREALGDSLKELYNYIQTTDDLKWYNVMAKAEEIANDMMQLNVPINYFREVMTDIRKDKVSLSEEQYAEAVKLYGSYGNLHKALFGSINLTKSGKPLEEQWKDWSKAFPTVFKADISAVDMVKELRDTVDALKNTSAVMGEYERQEAIRHMGMEIYNQFWNIASDSSEAVRKERVAHREMMQEMRKDYEKRQAEKTLHPTGELALKYEKLLKDTIKRDRAEMKRIRELGNKRMEEYKERAEVRATIQKITKNALTLNEWFVKNSKDKHIPEEMKGAVVQLVTAIDFSSKQMLGIGGAEERRGQPTQKDMSLAKALSRLYEVADEMKDNQTEDEVFLDLDIPDSAVALLKQLSTKSLVLNQMTLEQLQALDVIVSTFKSAIIKANKNFVLAQNETRERTSNLLIHDADSLAEKKGDNLATNFLEYANTTPYYMLKRLGRVGEQIFNVLMDAQEQLVFLEEEIINFVKKTVDGKKIKQWSEEIHEIKILDGKRSTKEEPKYKTIKMTTAQIMSLYALEKRESAKLHLAGGGIRIANIKDGLNTIKDAEGSSLSNSELYSIIGRLTNEQKRVADALQKYMSETGAEWGNKVTMARWDIKQFGEENYFPMATVAQDRNLDDVGKKDNSIYRLLNMSFAKELTPKANNQLVIDNIFDVFSSHMTDMAKYTTHALPLLDTMKILGYSRKDFYKDGDGKTSVRHDTISVASSIRRAFGDNGYRYIINLLKDLNGVEVTPRDEAITKTLMSNYKISAVGGNLRVALLQGSAFVKAGLVMNPNYLIKALGTNGLNGMKKAMKHSGIALWKSKGHYDLNIARSVASEIKQDENWMDKVREWSLKGAEWGDKITWGYLWNACELWAKENTPYSYNSAEFNKAVADKLREIIVKTQVVDSTMTRSQMMRGKSAMVQTLTAFMSESTMTYNMVADAFFEWSLDARKSGNNFKAYKNTFSKHGRKFATTASVYALTAFATALAGGFVDAVRDDDEEKEFDEKYLQHLLEALGDNVNLFANLPIFKDIVSIAQGYTPSRFDEQSFVNLVSGYKKWLKVAEGEGNVYSATYKTLQGLSQLTGLPVSNMMRDVVAMWNSTIGEMYPNLKIEQ